MRTSDGYILKKHGHSDGHLLKKPWISDGHFLKDHGHLMADTADPPGYRARFPIGLGAVH